MIMNSIQPKLLQRLFERWKRIGQRLGRNDCDCTTKA